MKTIFLVLMLCVPAGVFAQEITGAEKIDEFGPIYCCNFGARIDNASIRLRANPGSRIYLIFYNARGYDGSRWNAKLRKREPVRLNPIRGEFAGFSAAVRHQASFLKLDMNNFVVKDGGFREKIEVEIWILPAGAEPPQPTPTVDAKSVKLRRGRSHFLHICDYI